MKRQRKKRAPLVAIAMAGAMSTGCVAVNPPPVDAGDTTDAGDPDDDAGDAQGDAGEE